MTMFIVELLPARHGDALWIEYGDPQRPHRILVDGGPRSRATRTAVEGLVTDRGRDIELLAVSHVDADHITGVLDLLENRAIALRPREVWFNGWEHLPTDVLGPKQGERLGAAIVARRLPWNTDFGGGAVMVPDTGPLPVVEMPGGMRLTLLSPTRGALAALRPVWRAEVEKAGLVPGGAAAEERAAQPDVLGTAPLDPHALAAEAFSEDDSAANGSSLAFLAEFDGRSLLLTGDAHAGVLAAGLRRLATERGTAKVHVDAFKLPHHGSRHNLSGEVLDLVDCHRYLFSTSGHLYRHPDRVTVSRVVTSRDDTELGFNYRTEFTEPWESSRMRRRFRYELRYPSGPEPWLRVPV
jgi:hypothetical protein